MIEIAKINIDFSLLEKTANNFTEFKGLKGIYREEDNIIYFNENKTKVEIRLGNEKLFLTRESDDIKVKLEFDINKNTTSTLYIKPLRNYLDVSIITDYLMVKSKSIKINYKLKLSNEDFKKYEFNLTFKEE